VSFGSGPQVLDVTRRSWNMRKSARFWGKRPFVHWATRGAICGLCHNRVLFGTRLRHEVGDLDTWPPVYAHLLHHLVEEVFSLGVRAGRAARGYAPRRAVGGYDSRPEPLDEGSSRADSSRMRRQRYDALTEPHDLRPAGVGTFATHKESPFHAPQDGEQS